MKDHMYSLMEVDPNLRADLRTIRLLYDLLPINDRAVHGLGHTVISYNQNISLLYDQTAWFENSLSTPGIEIKVC